MQDPGVRAADIWLGWELLSRAVASACFPADHYPDCLPLCPSHLEDPGFDIFLLSQCVTLSSKKARHYSRGSVLIIFIIYIYIFRDLFLLSEELPKISEHPVPADTRSVLPVTQAVTLVFCLPGNSN